MQVEEVVHITAAVEHTVAVAVGKQIDPVAVLPLLAASTSWDRPTMAAFTMVLTAKLALNYNSLSVPWEVYQPSFDLVYPGTDPGR